MPRETAELFSAQLSTEQKLAIAREALEGVNEWFGQREDGGPTTNSEEAMFNKVYNTLNLLAPATGEPLTKNVWDDDLKDYITVDLDEDEMAEMLSTLLRTHKGGQRP